MFADDDWNQMVVKAIFVEVALWPIQGLDARNNPDLARMLVALLHERRAAGRPISAEIWRCIVPFADRDGEAAIMQAWNEGAASHRHAIALALRTAPDRVAGLPLFDRLPEIEAQLDADNIGWPQIAG